MKMDDDAEPRSLFVVVSWGFTAPNFSSILQLDMNGHVYNGSSPTTQTQVIETDFSLTFSRPPRPPPQTPALLDFWAYSLMESCNEAELYMVPDWCLKEFPDEDPVPLHGCIFNLKTKKCKPIKHPQVTKFRGLAVSLGGHIYFMAHPASNRKNTTPAPVFECYDPLKDEWETLEPFPEYAMRVCYGRSIAATAVWKDTILMKLYDTDIWAYNSRSNKWYPVYLDDSRCYHIVGQTVVLENTIYALSGSTCNAVVALSIETRGDIDNDDLVYECSLLSEILVPGMESIHFKHEQPCPMYRHLVYLGQDKLCLVQSRTHIGFDYDQHIQVTNIKLNNEEEKSMSVTNTCVYRFNLVQRNWQFEVKCCFSLPDSKTCDLKQGETTLEWDPFPDGYLSKRAFKYQNPTLFNFYGRIPVQEQIVTLPKDAPLFNVQATSSLSSAASSSSVPHADTSAAITDNRLTVLPPVSSKAVKFIPRPNFGTSGLHAVIKANHFRVDFAFKDIYHYDVKITPEVFSKEVCRDILEALRSTANILHLGMRKIAYDGRNSVYTAGPLPFESQDFDVVLSDSKGLKRERKFQVKITFAARIDLDDAPQETIQALDVVLRDAPSAVQVSVGRSFFKESLGTVGSLGEGLDYWYGFYQSLRPTQMGLSLNIDILARPFYEPILVTDFIVKCLNLREGLKKPLSKLNRLEVKKALKGVRVEITHPQSVRQYKITGLSIQPLNKLTFSVVGSGEKSVVNYFREKYNIALQYEHLPALQAGTDARPAYLPMEVCTIVAGQRFSKQLNDKQVSAMLKATCQRPSARERYIKQMVKDNNYNNDYLVNKEFGMEVTGDLKSVDARVLKPPILEYKGSIVVPHLGQWNMINKKMVNGGQVFVWACVNFSTVHVHTVYEFCEKLVSMCCTLGMVINRKPVICIKSDHPRNAERLLSLVHNECNLDQQLQLLIVILPETSGLYGTIKRVCETELGIVSQCCQSKHLWKADSHYLSNLALKINVKVGGTNLRLAFASKSPQKGYLSDMPTIVFGADVTHPQPGDDSSSSIAAVVASMNWPDVTKYRGLVSAQSHRQEIIQDLYTCSDETHGGCSDHGGMIREHLMAYYKSTGFKPSRIIFYRDGVSEGQFSQVLLHEIDSIRKACQSLQKDYLPPITFVVVQKRHHTRLFVGNRADKSATDSSGNILPGTVVDTEICHPTEFDFYLCSHAGIQGTSRPTHYHVLFDENDFSADQLQGLTYNLCYTYARCTRSVSVVPPVYYAHLAAFRARYYVQGRPLDVASSLDGRRVGEPAKQVRKLPDIKDNVKEVMFYC